MASSIKWSMGRISQFIKLYKSYPCLYNTLLEDYKDREKRREAVTDIAEQLQCTVDEVKSKMNSLRSQYNRERSKEAMSRTLGVEKPNITWIHYEPLSFLREFTVPRTSYPDLVKEDFPEKQDDTNLIENDEESEIASKDGIDLVSDSSETRRDLISTKRPLGKRKVKPTKWLKLDAMLREKEELLEKASPRNQVQRELEDPDQLFGRYIASELKMIKDEAVKRFLKNKIQNLVFEVQLPASPFLISDKLFNHH